ncbi:phosphonate C-P lyase system protein PhnH [Rhodospirillaceae bacterium SYSU D60014]|uniref:phosphonate C-P lyase system protein PhnH n=1 Tax=Virgifigura deserti TaxID=2268457 RepID=UPI000E66D597
MTLATTGAIGSAFADPVLDAQRTFRVALEALARPGRLVESPSLNEAGWTIGPAAASLCLSLVDHDTPVWLDAAAADAAAALRFHCGCPIVTDAGAAQFAVIGDGTALGPLIRFTVGTDAYPDRSATLIVEVGELREGGPLRLRGPGIETEHRLTVEGLPDGFWRAWRENVDRFPEGVDMFLTCGARLCGLPRTTIVEG